MGFLPSPRWTSFPASRARRRRRIVPGEIRRQERAGTIDGLVEMARHEMCVLHRHHDRGVSEQFGDRQDVRPAHRVPARKSVPQIVPAEIFDAGFLDRAGEPIDGGNLLGPGRARRHEFTRAGLLLYLIERGDRRRAQDNRPLAALPVRQGGAIRAIDVGPAQSKLLAQAHPGREREIELGLAIGTVDANHGAQPALFVRAQIPDAAFAFLVAREVRQRILIQFSDGDRPAKNTRRSARDTD